MSLLLTMIVACGMVGLLVARAIRAQRIGKWKPFFLETAGLLAFALFLYGLFGFPVPAAEAVAKGPQQDLTLVCTLFVCMLLGMLAHVLYQHFSSPKPERVGRKIDWALFFAPVCASPIVFIPLMVALQNANIDLKALTVPRMMIFFVAFQNGFFWKEHFDRTRKDVEVGRI